MDARIYYRYAVTTFGRLLLVGSEGALIGLHLADHERCPAPDPSWLPDGGRLDEVRRQLCEYFAGDRITFDVEVRPQGTEFQRTVWSALLAIPYGETASYGEIAAEIGRPQASRAVGAANGQNPVPLVIPCHRVVGADGQMTGFGLGIERKAWLLDHEQGRARLAFA